MFFIALQRCLIFFSFFFSEDTLQKKWKYLKDKLREDMKKFPKPRSGDAGDIVRTSKWPHFSSLQFLTDSMEYRKSSGNLSSSSDSTVQDDNEQRTGDQLEQPTHSTQDGGEQRAEDDIEQPTQDGGEQPAEDDIEQSTHSTHHGNHTDDLNTLDNDERSARDASEVIDQLHQSSTSKGTSSSRNVSTKQNKTRRKKPKQPVNDNFSVAIEVEREKLKLLKDIRGDQNPPQEAKQEVDEHLLFFQSLLPHMRKIPEEDLLEIRCRIINVIREYNRPNLSYYNLH